MQDIIIKRDILDRMLGLSTIIVENAAMGGGMMMPSNQGNYYNNMGRTTTWAIGMSGNKFVLPGITLTEAEGLRDWLLNISIKVVSKQEGHEL